jgi:phosphoribosylaminoimidazole carboxylase PurE protein
MMARYSVLLVAAGKSDVPVMQEAQKTLDGFEVTNRLVVMSAHRDPEKVRMLAKKARQSGTQVIIAGAGMAAHLAGTLASYTTVPVIGIPLYTEPFGALDSLLSTLQMPRGVPVALVTVGRAGAVNAAILAVEMLSIKDDSLIAKLDRYRKELSSKGR